MERAAEDDMQGWSIHNEDTEARSTQDASEVVVVRDDLFAERIRELGFDCAFGVLLLAWTSLRVVLLRKGITQQTVKDIKGLAMFPTMRTMSLRPKKSG